MRKMIRLISLFLFVNAVASCATTTYEFSPHKGAEKNYTVHHNLGGQEFSPFLLKKDCPHGVKSVTVGHGLISIFTSMFSFRAGVDTYGYNPLDLQYQCLASK